MPPMPPQPSANERTNTAEVHHDNKFVVMNGKECIENGKKSTKGSGVAVPFPLSSLFNMAFLPLETNDQENDTPTEAQQNAGEAEQNEKEVTQPKSCDEMEILECECDKPVGDNISTVSLEAMTQQEEDMMTLASASEIIGETPSSPNKAIWRKRIGRKKHKDSEEVTTPPKKKGALKILKKTLKNSSFKIKSHRSKDSGSSVLDVSSASHATSCDDSLRLDDTSHHNDLVDEEHAEQHSVSEVTPEKAALASTEMKKLLQEKKFIHTLQKDISSIKSLSREISCRAETISKDIERTYQKLENLVHHLEIEQQNMQNCNMQLTTLEMQKQTLEDRVLHLERQITSPQRQDKVSTMSDTASASSTTNDVPSSPTALSEASTAVAPVAPLETHPPKLMRSISSFIRTDGLHLPKETNVPPLFSLESEKAREILSALAQHGFTLATTEVGDMWIPNKDTEKFLRQQKSSTSTPQRTQNWNFTSQKTILAWSGKINHNGYGSEIPFFKARGIISAPPIDVVELILDSTRVKEYNKMSLGRTDLHYFQKGISNEGHFGIGESKIIKSVNKPPMMKPIEMTSLICVRPLEEATEGRGYLAVSRAVHDDEHGNKKESNQTEMLLSVNLFMDWDEGKKTELTTVTHVFSPGVPLVLGKKMGLVQAVNFMKDVQNVFR